MTKASFQETLEQINKNGGFQASVLASSEGLPVAQAPSQYDSEIIAAMVALLKSVAQQTQDHVGIGRLDEVSVRADDRVRLICRYFQIDGEDFILAVVVPTEQRYYRLETNRAIRKLRSAWNAMVSG